MKASTDAIPLWSGKAPLSLGQAEADIPTLTPFIPEKKNSSGTSVVVCPGGGYADLSDHEGEDYALYLNALGITAFVLKYRLGSNGYRHPAMLMDAARAVRFVRYHSGKYGINPHRIGIMGSSAGGHLASTLMTHFDGGDSSASDPIDRLSSRPDFGILCYPVVSMIPSPSTHEGSRTNLLGDSPSMELMESVSNEKQVTPHTPLAFLWHTTEDQAVPVANSVDFATQLQKNGVPYDLHIYQKGAHGIGLADKPPFNNPHPWAKDLVFWFQQNGLLQ